MFEEEVIPYQNNPEILYEAVLQATFIKTPDGKNISGQMISDAFSPKLLIKRNGCYWISMQKLAKHLDDVFHILNLQKHQPYPDPSYPASMAMSALESAGLLKRIHEGYDKKNQLWQVKYFGKPRYPHKK